jgi:hypothetical protein
MPRVLPVRRAGRRSQRDDECEVGFDEQTAWLLERSHGRTDYRA